MDHICAPAQPDAGHEVLQPEGLGPDKQAGRRAEHLNAVKHLGRGLASLTETNHGISVAHGSRTFSERARYAFDTPPIGVIVLTEMNDT